MKRDGRRLDHQTLEALRLMAMERLSEGETASAVMASFGFCRTTIYKWQRKARGRKGLEALRSPFGQKTRTTGSPAPKRGMPWIRRDSTRPAGAPRVS